MLKVVGDEAAHGAVAVASTARTCCRS